MKKTIVALLIAAASPAMAFDAAALKHYFHPGFNQLSAGAFFPVAGAENQSQAGFITPAIEHDHKDGDLLIPGIDWDLLNLGYVGDTSNLHDFLHGKLAAGPSIRTGELVKSGMRSLCKFSLPAWDGDGYGALKAILSPGQDGIYADVGVYAAAPLNQLFSNPAHMKPEVLIGATLNKKFGAAAQPAQGAAK